MIEVQFSSFAGSVSPSLPFLRAERFLVFRAPFKLVVASAFLVSLRLLLHSPLLSSSLHSIAMSSLPTLSFGAIERVVCPQACRRTTLYQHREKAGEGGEFAFSSLLESSRSC